MGFWSRKPPIETKAATLAAPDAQLLELFGLTGLGPIAVGQAEALRVPAVSASIRIISEACSSLDRIVMVRNADGTEKADPDHPVAKLIRGSANDWLSFSELVRDLVAQSLVQDAGGIAWCNRVNGRVAEIICYRDGVIGVSIEDTGEPKFTLNNRKLDREDVIHLRGPFNKCALTLASEAIGIAHYLSRHAGNLFRNGARPAGVIEVPQGAGEKQIKTMKAGWKAAHEGSENSGKTAILFDGTKFHAITLNSTDAQFLENRKFQIIEIARAFGVPPAMLFELDRATWSNGEQQGKEFLTYALEARIQGIEAALGRALFSDDERETHRIHFVRDDLTQADLGARSTAYSSLISSRIINPNEARAWEGLPPYADGDQFVNPNTGSNQPGGKPQPETREDDRDDA